MDKEQSLNLLYLQSRIHSILDNIKDSIEYGNELDLNSVDADNSEDVSISAFDIKNLINYWDSFRKSLFDAKILDNNGISDKELTDYFQKRSNSNEPYKEQ